MEGTTTETRSPQELNNSRLINNRKQRSTNRCSHGPTEFKATIAQGSKELTKKTQQLETQETQLNSWRYNHRDNPQLEKRSPPQTQQPEAQSSEFKATIAQGSKELTKKTQQLETQETQLNSWRYNHRDNPQLEKRSPPQTQQPEAQSSQAHSTAGNHGARESTPQLGTQPAESQWSSKYLNSAVRTKGIKENMHSTKDNKEIRRISTETHEGRNPQTKEVT
ncbi:hypothetical protein F511_21133 [Dorcoceras hygrometricum]|uniref:Uncharacterized protein n=1 Tax=Dorcoceras hygrometricum TaxID=472368 RepID=A0A2Z7CMN0_9LAMI|nr:hypothetical protein F511_21133 [Dorcoceras hygrometricum]